MGFHIEEKTAVSAVAGRKVFADGAIKLSERHLPNRAAAASLPLPSSGALSCATKVMVTNMQA
jgi:hypothetical protein